VTGVWKKSEQTWQTLISLTPSLPQNGGRSSSGAGPKACSLMGQLFPFSVIGAIFEAGLFAINN
jgi:hypothetical protein